MWFSFAVHTIWASNTGLVHAAQMEARELPYIACPNMFAQMLYDCAAQRHERMVIQRHSRCVWLQSRCPTRQQVTLPCTHITPLCSSYTGSRHSVVIHGCTSTAQCYEGVISRPEANAQREKKITRMRPISQSSCLMSTHVRESRRPHNSPYPAPRGASHGTPRQEPVSH